MYIPSVCKYFIGDTAMLERMRLPGAKFELLNCNKQPIMCVVTNCNGEAFIDCLPYGKYYLREIEAPCGYEKSCQCIEIIIGDQCRNRCVEVVNKRKTGSVKIIKYGTDFC